MFAKSTTILSFHYHITTIRNINDLIWPVLLTIKFSLSRFLQYIHTVSDFPSERAGLPVIVLFRFFFSLIDIVARHLANL